MQPISQSAVTSTHVQKSPRHEFMRPPVFDVQAFLQIAGRQAIAETTGKPYKSGLRIGDPSRIRTCNPRSRNPLLYPVELWDRCGIYIPANMKNPLPRQARSEPFSATLRHSLSRW